MNLSHSMKTIYKDLEFLHKKHGLALHGSIFIFSLLLGISMGILILMIKVTGEKQNMLMVKKYENQVMTQLVKKIEAAPFK